MITRNFNLYLNAGHSVPLVINVNQYDSGEQWVFTLYNSDGTKYIPSTGAIVGIKSDGLGIINSGSVVDGNVVISETQQMTAAVGKAVFELLIDSQTHGTANFIVLVEEKPGNNADLSESDLSLLQEAIDATSPLPTGGTVGQVLTKTANGSAWSDAGTPTQEQVADAVSDWADEHITVETGVVIDTSLAVAGAAADAKKTGDEVSYLKSAIQSGGSFTADVKAALMALANAVAFKGDDPTGQTLIDALEDALYPPVNLDSITCVYTPSGTVYDTDSLNSLKSDLVVTAHYSDSTSEVLADSAYTLSGALTAGTSVITVTYGGKTATFNVTVVHNDYLYVMPSEFVSTGSDTFETNVQLETDSTVTFLADYTITTTQASSTGHTVDYVIGNKVSGNNSYLALQEIGGTTKYMWGMGISYNSGKNLAVDGHRYRMACVITVNADGSSSCAMNIKDLTAGTAVKTYSNTYGTGSAITLNSYYLGKEKYGSVNNGFIGTMHDFRVYDGTMSSADITDYLTNGAS